MIDRPIAAFDIETIPDPEVGRRVFSLSGDDRAVVAEMVRQRFEETEGSTEYPQLPYHRIVTVGVAWLDPAKGAFKLGTLGDAAMDERSHLEAFFRMIDKAEPPPRLVSWNGNGFDLPVIRYRSLLHVIPAPGFYRTDGEWKWNNYQNRFHDMHVDLIDVLSGYGASYRVGLGTLSRLVGLPEKEFIEEPIYEHILRGEEDLVAEYCKLDCLDTLLLYLLWALHCGQLAEGELREHVKLMRRELGCEPAWAEIAERLENWPQWPAAPRASTQTPSTERSEKAD